MATVRLYGDLKRFGREFRLNVSTVSEAFRALCAQLPGFRQAMTPNYYRVRLGRNRYVRAEQLERDLGQAITDDTVIHLVPVAAGAKKGWGIFNVIAGVALVVVGVVTGNPALIAAGVGMALGGVAMMLTPTPKTPAEKNTEAQSRNTSFSNLDNILPQGRPVPVAYGEFYTGSVVISQGLQSV